MGVFGSRRGTNHIFARKLKLTSCVIAFVHYFHDTVLRLRGVLQTLGVLKAMQDHRAEFEALMCRIPMPHTTALMESLFGKELSEPGSNRRNVENRVYAWWLESLQDIEGLCSGQYSLTMTMQNS